MCVTCRCLVNLELFSPLTLNPLTAGVAYILVFSFYYHIMYHLLNMLKIKCDINPQYLKTVDLHFVKFRLNNLAGKGFKRLNTFV